MPLSPTTRFTATVQDYESYRPDYPPALMAWVGDVLDRRPPARVVDVGCGTGIASRAFAMAGYSVTGVEPNDAMRAAAERSGISCVSGTSDGTTLPDGCADLLIAAQAWHWFDVEPTLAEWGRVAADNAWAVVFWNFRVADAAFNRAYAEVLCGHVKGYDSRWRGEAAIEALRMLPLPGIRETHVPHSQTLDWEGLLGRARSSSYVAHGVRDLRAFERDLAQAYEAHCSPSATVDITYRTKAVAWPLSS